MKYSIITNHLTVKADKFFVGLVEIFENNLVELLRDSETREEMSIWGKEYIFSLNLLYKIKQAKIKVPNDWTFACITYKGV